MQQGRPLPKTIENAPELEIGLGFYYDAFWELNTCRFVGMSEGPIPWTAIYQYCSFVEIYGDQLEDMIYYVRAMDNYYLDYREKKDKNK